MKTKFLRFFAGAFAGLLLFFTYTSCEIGLGPAVDTQAPGITIEKPEVDMVIRQKFIISGTWTDDGTIDKVYVKLKRTDGRAIDGKSKKELDVPGSFELSEVTKESGTWKAEIDPLSKDTPILDGTYQAIVYIKDKGNHTTTQSTTFTIDNTAPVLILTKPNSTPGDKTVSAYGQRLFLEGSIADSTKDTWIEIKFYSDQDCTPQNLLETLETGLIAPTDVNSNNARLAVFSEDLTQELAKEYNAIYGKLTKEGSKTIYSTFTVYDTAETCTETDEEQLRGKNGNIKGNNSQTFYISKLLADSITKSKQAGGYGLAPIDIYNVLNGSYELKNQARAADATVVREKLENAALKKDKAVFELNPENSPYFTVSGLKSLVSEEFKKGEGYTIVNGTQTLEISVFMGSDSIALNDDENFYVYILECNEDGSIAPDFDKEENRIKLYSKSREEGSGAAKKTYYELGGKTDHKTTSGAYVFNVPMSQKIWADPDKGSEGYETVALQFGHRYRIFVSGKDTEGNPIESSDPAGYGFVFTAGGAAPIVTIEEPKDTIVRLPKGAGLTVKGSVKSEEGKPDFVVKYSDEDKKHIGQLTIELGAPDEKGNYSFNYEIPADTFAQDESLTYSLEFEAIRDETKTSYPKSVWYDVEGPEITMGEGYPSPLITAGSRDGVTKDSVNGIIKLSGSIVDKFDQFDYASYVVKQNGSIIDNDALKGTLKSNFEFALDTTLLADQSNATIVITASDRAGNESTGEFTYWVDQSTDKPQIISTEAGKDITKGIDQTGYEFVEHGNNLFIRGGNLVLSVSDDDGVSKAHVLIQEYDKTKPEGQRLQATTDVNAKQNIDYNAPSVISHTLPNFVGVYQATVTVYDKNYVSDAATPYNVKEIQFFLRVTGTGPDVSITPDREYIKRTSKYILTFNIRDEGNKPYMLKLGDTENPITGYEEIYDDEFTYEYTPETGAQYAKFTVIDKNSSFTEKNFTPRFDDKAPEISITTHPDKETTGDAVYNFKGSLDDKADSNNGKSGVKEVKVQFSDTANPSVNSGWINVESFGSLSWNYEAEWGSTNLAAVFATETSKTITVKAIDGAGNESTDSYSFVYDKQAPVISAVLKENNKETETTNGRNAVKVDITITDTNPDRVEVKVYRQTGPQIQIGDTITQTSFTGSGNEKTATVTIPNTKFTSEEDYTIKIQGFDANDRASNIVTKTIKYDKTIPTVTIETPSSNVDWANAHAGSSYTFKVSVSDPGGSGVQSISYAMVKQNTPTPPVLDNSAWKTEAFTGGEKLIQEDSLTEGQWYFYAYATDKAGNDIGNDSNNIKRVLLSIDTGAPTLTVTNSLDEVHTNVLSDEVATNGYEISGTLTDTNKLATSDALVIKVDGVTKATKTAAEVADGWSYTIKKGTTAGTLKSDTGVEVEIIARDITGKAINTVTKKYTLYYDTKVPELIVTAPVPTEAVSQNSLAIKGTVSDNGYGVDKVEYTLKRGSTTVTSSSVNPVTIKGEQWYIDETQNGGKIPLGTPEGALTLSVTATEKKIGSHGGRSKTENVNFYYDKANPTLTETGIGTTSPTTKEGFTLKGKVWDSNELDRIEIKCGSTTWKSTDTNSIITLTKATSEPSDINWSASFKVGNETGTDPKIDDGTHEFIITAYDVTGKEKQLTRTVIVDTTKPDVNTLEIKTAVGATVNGVNWYKSRSLLIEVSATDTDGTGVSKVEYTTDNGTNWNPLSYNSSSKKYTGTVSFTSDGKNQSFKVRATDVAENVSDLKTVTVNIDTSAPELSVNKEGNIYVQKDSSITVYGNYQDAQSGVKELSFMIGIGETETSILPEVTYSATAINGNTIPADTTYKTYANSTPDTIKSWKAVFTPTKSGKLIVQGENRAGDKTSEIKAFDITIDASAPVISNVKLEEGSDEAYKGADGKYYINNSTTANKSFKISGVSTDDTGIKSVTIAISGVTTPPAMTGTTGKWSFDLSSIIGKTTGATATVTVEDLSGRTSPEKVKIVFDTTPPTAKHWADAKNKDIYFRIGAGTGGKYSYGTYGKDSSMELRGTFEETGSGLRAVYYKIYDSEPTETDISDFVDGSVAADGSIKVVAEETSTIEYNINDSGSKGNVTVKNNFHDQVQGFNSDNNYLVLVAEDYAGNRAADTLAKYSGSDTVPSITSKTNWNCENPDVSSNANKAYYHLNKDTQAPEIISTTTSKYTNGNAQAEAITITGTATDSLSGINSVTVTVEEISFTQEIKAEAFTGDSGNIWTATIAANKFATIKPGTYTVYAEAKDSAGEGNTKKISAATVTVDRKEPELKISSPAGTSAKPAKLGSSFTITGTASDGTGAGLSSEAIKIYYRTTEPAKDASGNYTKPESASGWTELSGTTIPNTAEWTQTINASSISTNNANTTLYFTISGKDASGTGNVGYAVPVKIIVDRKVPEYDSDYTEASIGGKAPGTITNNTWFKDSTLVVKGKFKDDGGSGVTKITYRVDSNAPVEIPTNDGTYNTNVSGFTANSTLYIKATDASGLTCSEISYPIKVDGVQPEITEEDDDDFTKPTLANGTSAKPFTFHVTDSGSKINPSNPGSVIVKVGSNPITHGQHGSSVSITAVSGTSNKWLVTVTVGKDDIPASGNHSVLVAIDDIAGNRSNSQSIGTINVDSDPPVPTFTSHKTGDIVNKTIVLKGMVTDPNNTAITGVALSASGNSQPVIFEQVERGSTNDGKHGYISYKDGQWTATLDTTKIYDSTGTKELTLSLTATDEAGNTSTAVTIKPVIDQKSDRPVITLSQLTKNTEKTLRLKNVYGSILDDDGEVKNLWYWPASKHKSESNTTGAPAAAPSASSVPEGWLEISVNGGSWSVDSEEEDGDTTWYFAVKDNNNNYFTTKGTTVLTRPYIKYTDVAENQDNTTGVSFKYDTNPPTPTYLGLVRYPKATQASPAKTINEIYTADTNDDDEDDIAWSTSNNIAFGGDYNILYAKIEVTESTGMKALSGSDGSAPTSSPVLISYKNTDGKTYNFEQIKADVSSTDSSKYTYYLGPLTMDTTEAIEFKVTVEDAVGNKGFISRNIIVDNEEPTGVSNLKPNAQGEQNGTFTYRGDANDNTDGSGVVKVEWCIPNTTQTTTAAEGLNWVEAPLSSQWEIDFSGANNMSDIIHYTVSGNTASVGANYSGYETDTTNHSGVYNIPVWFRLTDEVGNIGYDTTNGRIKYNPNTDRPSVLIGSPVHNLHHDTKNIDYVIMGGKTARISGSADDDEGIGKVYLQFDMNGDGKWDTGVSGLSADLATQPTNSTAMIAGTPWKGGAITEIATYKNAVKTSSLGYGIEVGTTKNWAYTLDLSSSSLPKIDATHNGIKVRAIAIDNDTANGQLASAWSEVLNVSVSNDIPLFNNLKVKQYNGNTLISSIDYVAGMYLTGDNWFITADVSASGGISAAEYDRVSDALEYFTGSGDERTMKIPVDLSEGSWNVTIRVVDKSTNKNANTQQIQLNVDNTPPSFAETYASASVAVNGTVKHYMNAYGAKGIELTPTARLYDINDYASLWGKVFDNGSGFDKAVFYFKRTDAGSSNNPRVYNLMAANVQTAINASHEVGEVYINTTQNTGDNLPALYVKTDSTAKMTVTRPSDYSIKVALGNGATVTGVSGNSNIRPGGLIKIGGLYRTITAVSEDTVTFTPACETTFLEAEFIYGMVIDSSGETKTGDDINESDGDGLLENFQTITGTTTWNAALPTGNIPDGPVELHVVVFDAAGNMAHGYTKTGIENKPLRITKVMLGTNFNGNTTYDVATEFETFYALMGSNGTADTSRGMDVWNLDTKEELGGSKYFTVKNGLAVIPEFVGGSGDVYYKFTKSDADKTTAETLTASNNIKLGTSNLINGAVTASGTGNKVGQLVLDNNTIGETGEGQMKHFNFSFWDSTDGATAGSDSSWTVLNALIFQDLVDETSPNVVIEPFRWAGAGSSSANAQNTTEVVRKFKYSTVKGNSGYNRYDFYTDEACTVLLTQENAPAADAYETTYVYAKESVSINSLYGNLASNGHIELSGDLPDAFTANNNDKSKDRDPKVSGKITFSGTAYDNVSLSSLWFSFDGLTPSNYLATPDKYGTSGTKTVNVSTSATANNKAFRQAAYYTPGTGWTTASSTISNGWEFTVQDEYFNQYGHRVRWTLSIDTSKIDGVAGTEKTLYMLAVDHNAETTATTKVSAFTAADTDSLKTADDGTNNVPSYKVDVVPYVSKVYTKLAKNKNSNWSVYNRTALGHYPVQSVVSNIDDSIKMKTTSSEDVTLYGFNLNHSSAAFTSGGKSFATTGTGTLKITAGHGDTREANLDYLTFNVAQLASGQLSLTVGGLAAMNNINANDADGSAPEAGDAYINWYNRQGNGDTNNILNDDLIFDVWEFNDRAAVPINGLATGINMEVNQRTGMLNYAFANGGLYYSMGGNTDKTRSYKNESYSSIYWAGDWDTFAGPCVGFHVDDQGYTYSVVTGGDTNNSGHVDKYAFYTSRWGKGTLGTGGTYGGGNSLRLEHIALKTGDTTYDYSLMKYRFLSSEFASTVNGDNTNLYMVYYDALTNQIRFRAGTFTKKEKETTGGFQDDATSQTPSWYATTNCQIIANGKDGATFKTGANTNATVAGISGRGAGQYVDVAVVKNTNNQDVVCVVWFDAEENNCKFSYTTNPIGNWNSHKGNATAARWSSPQTIFAEGGEYCHIVADKNNHLHIAAYAGNGDVMYSYLAAYSSLDAEGAVAPSCVVDASGAVGEHLTLDVAVVGTGANEHSIPYIGYYTSAIKMPKYAYLVDKTTGFSQTAAGVDEYERFTGAWEVTVVPSPSRMTTNREDKVNVGVWKNAGELTDSKINGSVMNSSHSEVGSTGYSATNWSKTFGNGTSNGVLGYQISTSTGSCLETAQMR